MAERGGRVGFDPSVDRHRRSLLAQAAGPDTALVGPVELIGGVIEGTAGWGARERTDQWRSQSIAPVLATSGTVGGEEPGASASGRSEDAASGSMTVPGRGAVHLLDVGLLVLVPLVLVSVFALPRPLKLELTLAYEAPTVRTAFTSHFVHLTARHLLVNLLAYAAVVPTLYVVSLVSGRRRRFLVAFATVVLAFPFVLSGLNLLFARPRIGYGFSGLAMAFVGVLAFSLWEFVATRDGGGLVRDRSPVLFFLATAIIAVRAVPSRAVGLGIIGLAVVGSIVFLWPRGASRRGANRRTVRRCLGQPRCLDGAVWGVLVVVLIPIAAFPDAPAVGGTVLNIYSHAMGFCLGYLVPYTALRVLGFRIE